MTGAELIETVREEARETVKREQWFHSRPTPEQTQSVEDDLLERHPGASVTGVETNVKLSGDWSVTVYATTEQRGDLPQEVPEP